MMKSACPVCGSTELLAGPFAERVPAHAVRLAPTAEDAMAEPRGTIALRFCEGCGFVFNAAFDESLLSYGVDYESTQTHSPTYLEYIGGVVCGLLDRVMREGAILDVGCGQGEFLAAFAAQTRRPLVGFDPALDETRLQVSGATLRPAPFRARDYQGEVALITCKMTLEHVEDPIAMLREIAELASASPAAQVFLQLPNCSHIFEKTLFSDIIYEHVNYFTEGALAEACAVAGLVVDEQWISYGNQHLNLLAHAGHGARSGAARDTGEGSGLGAERGLFTGFHARLADNIDSARGTVRALLAAGRRPMIWGAGSKAVAFLNFTGLEQLIDLAVDINPLKQGTFLPGSGIEIIAPDDARLGEATDIFVMNPVYADEIAATLHRFGFAPDLHLVQS